MPPAPPRLSLSPRRSLGGNMRERRRPSAFAGARPSIHHGTAGAGSQYDPRVEWVIDKLQMALQFGSDMRERCRLRSKPIEVWIQSETIEQTVLWAYQRGSLLDIASRPPLDPSRISGKIVFFVRDAGGPLRPGVVMQDRVRWGDFHPCGADGADTMLGLLSATGAVAFPSNYPCPWMSVFGAPPSRKHQDCARATGAVAVLSAAARGITALRPLAGGGTEESAAACADWARQIRGVLAQEREPAPTSTVADELRWWRQRERNLGSLLRQLSSSQAVYAFSHGRRAASEPQTLITELRLRRNAAREEIARLAPLIVHASTLEQVNVGDPEACQKVIARVFVVIHCAAGDDAACAVALTTRMAAAAHSAATRYARLNRCLSTDDWAEGGERLAKAISFIGDFKASFIAERARCGWDTLPVCLPFVLTDALHERMRDARRLRMLHKLHHTALFGTESLPEICIGGTAGAEYTAAVRELLERAVARIADFDGPLLSADAKEYEPQFAALEQEIDGIHQSLGNVLERAVASAGSIAAGVGLAEALRGFASRRSFQPAWKRVHQELRRKHHSDLAAVRSELQHRHDVLLQVTMEIPSAAANPEISFSGMAPPGLLGGPEDKQDPISGADSLARLLWWAQGLVERVQQPARALRHIFSDQLSHSTIPASVRRKRPGSPTSPAAVSRTGTEEMLMEMEQDAAAVVTQVRELCLSQWIAWRKQVVHVKGLLHRRLLLSVPRRKREDRPFGARVEYEGDAASTPFRDDGSEEEEVEDPFKLQGIKTRDWGVPSGRALAHLESGAMVLRSTLPAAVPRMLREMSEMMRVASEVSVMLGVPERVPEEGMDMYNRREQLLQQQLQVRALSRRVNAIRSGVLAVERPLVQDSITALDAALRPGMEKLEWCQGDEVDFFLQRALTTVARMEDALRQVRRPAAEAEELLQGFERGEGLLPLDRKRGDRTLSAAPGGEWEQVYKNYTVRRTHELRKITRQLPQILSATRSRLNYLRRKKGLFPILEGDAVWVDFLADVSSKVRAAAVRVVCSALKRLLHQVTPQWLSANDGIPLVSCALYLRVETTPVYCACPDFQPPLVGEESQVTVAGVVKGVDRCVLQYAAELPRFDGELGGHLKEAEEHEQVKELRRRITERQKEAIVDAERCLAQFSGLADLWKVNPAEFIDSIIGRSLCQPASEAACFGAPLAAFEQALRRCQQDCTTLRGIPSQGVAGGWLRVECQPLRDALMARAAEGHRAVVNHVRRSLLENLENVERFIETADLRLQVQAPHADEEDSSQQLIAALACVREVRESNAGFEGVIAPLEPGLALLQRNMALPPEVVANLDQRRLALPANWSRLMRKAMAVREQLAPAQESEAARLRKSCAEFTRRLEVFRSDFPGRAPMHLRRWATGDARDINWAYEQLDRVAQELAELDQEDVAFEEARKAFELAPAPSPHLAQCRQDLQTLKVVWDTVMHAREVVMLWQTESFARLYVDKLEAELTSLRSLALSFEEQARQFPCYQQLRQDIDEYLSCVPVTRALRCPSLRKRHWAALLVSSAEQVELPGTVTFGEFFKLGIHNNAKDVHRIVATAKEERKVERYVSGLRKRWGARRMPHRWGGRMHTWMLDEERARDLTDRIVHDLVTLHGLRGSPRAQDFDSELAHWINTLGAVQDVLCRWEEQQRRWRLLWSILQAADSEQQQQQGTPASAPRPLAASPSGQDLLNESMCEVETDLQREARVVQGLGSALGEAAMLFEEADEGYRELIAACRSAGGNIIKLLDLADGALVESLRSNKGVDAKNIPQFLDEVIGKRLTIAEVAMQVVINATRQLCPRFGFLTDAEALQALAGVSEPRHFLELFDRIAGGAVPIVLSPDFQGLPPRVWLAVWGVQLSGGERLEFALPHECQGTVAQMAEGIISKISQQVQEDTRAAQAAYAETSRAEWATKHGYQQNHLVCRVWFASEVESAFSQLTEGWAGAQKDLLHTINCNIAACAKAVKVLQQEKSGIASPIAARSPGVVHLGDTSTEPSMRSVEARSSLGLCTQGTDVESTDSDDTDGSGERTRITGLELLRLTHIIALDIEQRDLLQQLIAAGVTSAQDCEWVGTLRFAWHERSDPGSAVALCLDLSCQYGTEAVGLPVGGLPVVCGPGMARCRAALMLALARRHIGVITGPPSSGKGEVVRDLAAALAIPLATLATSEPTETLCAAVSRLCEAVMAVGAWLLVRDIGAAAPQVQMHLVAGAAMVFQEVDESDYTSISRHLSARGGLGEKEPGGLNREKQESPTHAALMPFEGGVRAVPHSGIFATLPAPLGRAQMPEGLRARLRPVRLGEPDIEGVAAVVLRATGFDDDAGVAAKLAALYRHCTVAIPGRAWGLPALFSFLAVWRRTHRDGDSSALVTAARAVHAAHAASLAPAELAVFERIRAVVFRTTQQEAAQSRAADAAGCIVPRAVLRDRIAALGLYTGEGGAFESRARMLCDVMAAGRPSVLCGPAGCGKTAVWRVASRAGSAAVLCPAAVGTRALYGGHGNGRWESGILASKYCSVDYLLFDCDAQPLWIDSIFPSLQFGTVACGGSRGQRTVTFETASLAGLSPSAVVRLGIITLQRGDVAWAALASSWALKEVPEAYRTALDTVCYQHLPNIFDWWRRQAPAHESVAADSLIPEVCLFRGISGLFRGLTEDVSETLQGKGAGDVHDLVDRFFAVSCLWAMGAALGSATARHALVQWWRKEFPLSINWSDGTLGGGWTPEAYLPASLSGRQSRASQATSTGTPLGDDLARRCITGQVPGYMTSSANMSYGAVGLSPGAATAAALGVTSLQFRLLSMADLLQASGSSVLICGERGSAKTVLLWRVRETITEPGAACAAPCSTLSDTPALVRHLMGALEDKGRHQYGPRCVNAKRLTVFIDDVHVLQNHPETGCALELVRQQLDHGTWHAAPGRPIEASLLYVVSRFGRRGDPRGDRLLRHFAVINCGAGDQEEMRTFIQAHLQPAAAGLQTRANRAVTYIGAVLCRLADAVNNHPVLQGQPQPWVLAGNLAARMTRALRASSETLKDRVDVMRLFKHECRRAVSDTLPPTQRMAFNSLLDQDMGVVSPTGLNPQMDVDAEAPWLPDLTQFFSRQGLESSGVVAGGTPVTLRHFSSQMVISADTIPGDSDEDEDTVEPSPGLVLNPGDAAVAWQCALSPVAEPESHPLYADLAGSSAPQGREFAIHALRVASNLVRPGAVVRMVGDPGVGKSTVAAIAARVAGLRPVRYVCMKAGNNSGERQRFERIVSDMLVAAVVHGEGRCLLIKAAALSDTSCLDVLSDIIGGGSLAALSELCAERQAVCNSEAERANAMATFEAEARAALRVVFCSPYAGERKQDPWSADFPVVFSRASVYHMSAWSHSHRVELGVRTLQSIAEDLGGEAKVKAVAEHCSEIHRSAALVSNGGRCEITARAHLEMLGLVVRLVDSTKRRCEDKARRLHDGLQKLQLVQDAAERLQKQLVDELEAVKRQCRRVDLLEKQAADDKRELVIMEGSLDDIQVKIDKQRVEVIQREKIARATLDELTPIVDSTYKALSMLDKLSLAELKAIAKPSPDVLAVVSAVQVLSCPDPRTLKDRSWNALKKMMLAGQQWVDSLKALDLAGIPALAVDQVNKLIKDHRQSFVPESLAAKSVAASVLCAWVLGVQQYHEMRGQMKPVEDQAKDAKDALNQIFATRDRMVKSYEQAKHHLAGVLQDAANAAMERTHLGHCADNTKGRLTLAKAMMASLGDQKERWSRESSRLGHHGTVLIGDVVLAAALVSHCGALSWEQRQTLLCEQWPQDLAERGIEVTEHSDPVHDVLATEAMLARWGNLGLPTNAFARQNAVITVTAHRWPLLVDPDRQATTWVRELDNDRAQHLLPTTSHYLTQLFDGVELGQLVLLESVGDAVDPAVLALLDRGDLAPTDRPQKLQLGDRTVPIHPDFRFILTTQLDVEVLPQALLNLATVVNFDTSRGILEDELLARVVGVACPALERERRSREQDANQRVIDIQAAEEALLSVLGAADCEMMLSQEVVASARDMRAHAQQVEVALQNARGAQRALQQQLERYRATARRGALLFHQVRLLAALDPMYRFSLSSFLNVFNKALEQGVQGQEGIIDVYDMSREDTDDSGLAGNPRSRDWDPVPDATDGGATATMTVSGTGDGRHVTQAAVAAFTGYYASMIVDDAQSVKRKVAAMCEAATVAVHSYVSAGLRRQDRLPFTAILCLAVLDDMRTGPSKGLVQCLLGGPPKPPDAVDPPPAEVSEWLPAARWADAVCLAKCAPAEFRGFPASLVSHARWRLWCAKAQPEKEAMPGDWRDAHPFNRLLALRCLRPDRLPQAMVGFIHQQLGSAVASPDLPTIEAVVRKPPGDTQQVLLWTYPGGDPLIMLEAMYRNSASLDDCPLRRIFPAEGDQWAQKAENDIMDCAHRGGWCVLTDAHLAPVSWLYRLEALIDGLGQEQHRSWRLILTAHPDKARQFPQGLLRRLCKLNTQPAGGLSAHAVQGWDAVAAEAAWLGVSRQPELRGTSALISLLHACFALRKEHGRRGWARCEDYAFSPGEVLACVSAMRSRFDTPRAVDWMWLRCVVCLVYSGYAAPGSPDAAVFPLLCGALLSDEALQSGIVPGTGHALPAGCPVRETREVLASLQLAGEDAAQAAGLLPGATEPSSAADAAQLAAGLSAFGGVRRELPDESAVQAALQTVETVLADAGGISDARIAERLSGCSALASSHALAAEASRLEQLLQLARRQVANPSAMLLGVLTCGRVPRRWKALSPRCLRPLGAWLTHLRERDRWLRQWASTPALVVPKVVNLGLLACPAAFLSSVMVSVAQTRQEDLADDAGAADLGLEAMTWVTEVTKKLPEQVDLPARDGVHLFGLTLDAARWNPQTHRIEPSALRTPPSTLPVVTLRAVAAGPVRTAAAPAPTGAASEKAIAALGVPYPCPVYESRERRSVITNIALPTGHMGPPAKWILGGCAVLLDDSEERIVEPEPEPVEHLAHRSPQRAAYQMTSPASPAGARFQLQGSPTKADGLHLSTAKLMKSATRADVGIPPRQTSHGGGGGAGAGGRPAAGLTVSVPMD
eukprot:TRINITY_DN9431_c0_g2_i1.p1 TRINITY_DN9431_c0_g2~~TRINITY_DN9431_c0_g2_i1.p1  ORF type:complete len:5112 (+),score=1388.46 TRINITY_DN9431_c0_g2_i1:85-15336(+)